MRTLLRSIVLSLLVVVFCVGLSTAQPTAPAPEFNCDYLGQQPPGETPVVFAPDILGPVGYRYRLAISPRGDEMYFSGDNSVIFRLRYDVSTKLWTGPEPSPFKGGEPSFSPDGRRLYFINRDPVRGSKVALNVWYVERDESGEWSPPKAMGSPVWDQTVHTPVIASSGNLYASGIIRLRFVDGKYQPAENLDPPVKGGHPTIAPDESYLLFDAPQPESRVTDLFVVYQNPDGAWTRTVNLGDPINTAERESNPTISPDGKYLFFTRHGKIYWVSAEVLERLNAPEVDREVLTSKILGEDRPLNIVLPAGYSSDKTYPVVYALDGGARYTPDLAERMQAAYADLIVVGIENVDRNRDMFPDPLPARENKGGGGERFLEFLTTELIPYIENKFSVNGYRVISGQSNSGFFVLYAMLNVPDVFDAYLASSPMVGWDWDMIRAKSVDLLEGRQSFPKVLFMNRGDTDYDQVTDYLPAYAELLRKISPADFRWKNEVVERDGHVPENSYGNGIAFIFSDR